jgi:hypothetical protein
VRDLNYQLNQLCRRNRDGSYATQAKQMHHLMLIGNQLHAHVWVANSYSLRILRLELGSAPEICRDGMVMLV